MNDQEFMASDTLRSAIEQIITSPQMVEAIAYLRRNAPQSSIEDLCQEMWQQVRRDGIVAGYNQALIDIESLPDTMRSGLGRDSAPDGLSANLRQHEDLPDYIGSAQ